MAPHSSTLACKIPWTEEPGRLQSMGSLGAGNDWVTSLSLFTFMHFRRKWQPTPVFLPGDSQGQGAWWAAVYGVMQSRTRLKWLSSSSSSDHSPRARHHGMWSQVSLGSITMNKASGGDGRPVELFQILKDDSVKVLHSICRQIWKTQQWPQDWIRSVFILIPKKGNAKECSNYHTIALISQASKVMLKILQVRLQ